MPDTAIQSVTCGFPMPSRSLVSPLADKDNASQQAILAFLQKVIAIKISKTQAYWQQISVFENNITISRIIENGVYEPYDKLSAIWMDRRLA